MTKMARREVSEQRLADALRKAAGIKSDAARLVGLTRQAVQDRVERSAVLRQAIKDGEEELLDCAEGKLKTAVRRGDKDMVRFQLQQKGKKRGYGNNVTVGLDDAQAEAIVAGLGGSAETFRAALVRLGVAQSEIP